jgi:HlyD family secretion protein
MRRTVLGFGVALLALAGLLGMRIADQRAALTGPAGGSGVVEATSITLSSRVGGRIVERAVTEGQPVKAGDLVLRLDCAEPDAALAEGEARLAAARAQADAAARAAAAQADAASAAEAAATASTAQGDAVRAQQAAAGRQAGRLDAIGADASAASRDQARATSDVLAAQADAASSQARATSAQARAARGQADAGRAQAEAATFQVAAAEAAIQRARVAASECRVVAPRDGVVQLLPWEVGELVGPGATLATLVDLSEVIVTFYLPNAELAAATVGAPATIAADAWPDRAFTGAVRTIATEPEFTPRNIQTRTDRDRLVFAVDVAVPNPDGALRPGMPADVTLGSTP